MKIYGLQYQNINGTYQYFMFTCKFLSVREKIDSELYEEMKKVFKIAGKNNSYLSGIYFDCI